MSVLPRPYKSDGVGQMHHPERRGWYKLAFEGQGIREDDVSELQEAR